MQRGEVLANGYTMHKIMDRGDYKFTSETFKLKAYSNTKCCHRCPAEKPRPLVLQLLLRRCPLENDPHHHCLLPQGGGADQPIVVDAELGFAACEE